jgi:hypothetical protein
MTFWLPVVGFYAGLTVSFAAWVAGAGAFERSGR